MLHSPTFCHTHQAASELAALIFTGDTHCLVNRVHDGHKSPENHKKLK